VSRFEIDDQFLCHHKTKRALRKGPESLQMWLAFRTYSAINNSDGIVPDEDIDDLDGAPKNPRKWLAILIECGRPLPGGTRGPGLIEQIDGGFRLHDYRDHGLSPEEVERRRELSRDRQRRWRDARVGVTNASRNGVTPCVTNASGDTPDPIRSEEIRSDLDPVSKEPDRYSAQNPEPAAHTPRIDRCMAAFVKPKPASIELFEAWKHESGKTNASMDAKRVELFERLALEGITKEQVIECVRGAKLDDWARDSAKLSPSAVLGSAEQREKFASMARSPPKPRGFKSPPQPNDENNRYKPRIFGDP
jgi:hypothetical protein